MRPTPMSRAGVPLGTAAPAASRHADLMQGDPSRENEALTHLRELVDALDRRLPRVEGVGEASIAKAAAALREDACRRIAELEQGSDSAASQDGRCEPTGLDAVS